MKRTMIVAMLLAGLSACGAKQSPVETETVATTEDSVSTDSAESPDEPEADPNALPAPSNVAAPPPNAETSASGLAWIVLEHGDGAQRPTIDSTITVHYTGWTTTGEMFDSSVVRNEPIEFPLAKLIPGWQEGIPMMTRGESRRFWIPGELAYGNSSRPDAPKGMLVFDIQLIDFQ